MMLRLSDHQVSLFLRHLFRGWPQQAIADVLVCQKVKEPGFVSAALELAQAEAQAGLTYQETLGQFEEVVPELEHIKSEMAASSASLKKGVITLQSRKGILSAALTELQSRVGNEQWEHQLLVGFMALVTAQSHQDIADFVVSVHKWLNLQIIGDPVAARGELIKLLMPRVLLHP
jgi:hypothetical protein